MKFPILAVVGVLASSAAAAPKVFPWKIEKIPTEKLHPERTVGPLLIRSFVGLDNCVNDNWASEGSGWATIDSPAVCMTVPKDASNVTTHTQVQRIPHSIDDSTDGCVVRLYAKDVTDCSRNALGERAYSPYCSQSDLTDVGSMMLDCSKLYGEKLVMS